MRHRFVVEYLGTPYAGWQIQPGARTVQGDLEKALGTALRTEIGVVGSGRTDAGVHARGQVAHADLPDGVDVAKLQRSLNALAGGDLAVRAMEPCPETFHARYSALTRRYRYRLALRPSPLQAPFTWRIRAPLRADLLSQELASVLGEHDFVAFCVPRHDGKSTLCHVLRCEIGREDGDDFPCVHIEANRFLHKMVRSLVGAAVEVGCGLQAPGFIRRVLSGEKNASWTWAPPQGLCLEQVTYQDYDPK